MSRVRVRFRYAKLGKVRFCSHRDMARVWERSLRRAQLPVAYSEGFSPRPRLSFGLALSTGYESLAEYVDVELSELPDGVTASDLAETLTAVMPAGIAVTGAQLLERGADSLQQVVYACRWEIDLVETDAASVQSWIDRILEAPSITVTRERKGKPVVDDLRPQVLDLQLMDAGPAGVRIAAELATQPRALRPSELLAALDPPLREQLVRRTHQYIEREGRRDEPIIIAAVADAPHAEACVT